MFILDCAIKNQEMKMSIAKIVLALAVVHASSETRENHRLQGLLRRLLLNSETLMVQIGHVRLK